MQKAYITALTGGLGNQMFQYAMGRALAERHGAPLLLDVRGLQHDALRSYALSHFRISAELASEADMPRELGRLGRRLHRLPRWLTGQTRIVEQGFPFDPTILDLSPPLHLSGNWQSDRYFSSYADIIRGEFQLREAFTPDRQAIADLLTERPMISVHVRRGDYVSNATTNAYHGTCEPEWYDAARQRLAQQLGNAEYMVFSDDPDWARANLKDFSSAVFVEPKDDGRDEQDMHLMALCHHHIIANSSFSWWGAWLNPKPGKEVIAPLNWFRSAQHDTRDLIPANWTRL
ncbi:alpha-1,2-fucosyltransferase [Devosia sp.]|uniref:alpha-1,2-fucosyltransferase n=1 Tax=Devosia sp. TaxID=1871048 RepID=UPI001ACEB179|nr:alpha-1,2-fucosyltransferase [Devosia sp.]MBN9332130.1 alpha-1,2-fucosyltransferase [Devosia sp.]